MEGIPELRKITENKSENNHMKLRHVKCLIFDRTYYLSAVKDVLSLNGSISNLLSNGSTHFMLIEIHQCPIKVPVTHIYGQLDTLICCAFGCLL